MPTEPTGTQPFDPELPKRLGYVLAAIAAAPQCAGLDDDHIWLFEHGDRRVSLAEMTQLLQRLAYAERTRAELADKCADYRGQRDELHARSDDVAAVLRSGPRRNIEGRNYVRVDYVRLALDGHATRAAAPTQHRDEPDDDGPHETDPEATPGDGEHATCARCATPITWKTSAMWDNRWEHDGDPGDEAHDHDAELGGPA